MIIFYPRRRRRLFVVLITVVTDKVSVSYSRYAMLARACRYRPSLFERFRARRLSTIALNHRHRPQTSSSSITSALDDAVRITHPVMSLVRSNSSYESYPPPSPESRSANVSSPSAETSSETCVHWRRSVNIEMKLISRAEGERTTGGHSSKLSSAKSPLIRI